MMLAQDIHILSFNAIESFKQSNELNYVLDVQFSFAYGISERRLASYMRVHLPFVPVTRPFR